MLSALNLKETIFICFLGEGGYDRSTVVVCAGNNRLLWCIVQVWFANVPHTKLAEVKGHQNWVRVSGEYLIFPGGGTQFTHGAMRYIDFIQKVCASHPFLFIDMIHLSCSEMPVISSKH